METKKLNHLADLLPAGKMKEMAAEAGVTIQAVSNALRKAKPTNRFVQQALKIAKECGSLEAAQTMASLSA
jgi:predicted transcriptional regulator